MGSWSITTYQLSVACSLTDRSPRLSASGPVGVFSVCVHKNSIDLDWLSLATATITTGQDNNRVTGRDKQAASRLQYSVRSPPGQYPAQQHADACPGASPCHPAILLQTTAMLCLPHRSTGGSVLCWHHDCATVRTGSDAKHPNVHRHTRTHETSVVCQGVKNQ